MKEPPIASPNIPQPSRLPLQLATLALWLLIGINVVSFICSIGAARTTSKGEGVLWGSALFVLTLGAVPVACLALPAIVTHRHLRWPWFTFALGFMPLPVMAAVAQVMRFLRTFV